MRILGIGESMDLGSMYLDLLGRGHEVRVFVGDPAAQDTLLGLVPMVDDWESQLGWLAGGHGAKPAGNPAPDKDGFIVFETSTHGPLQESLRKDGFQVIGGSAYGDRLENDRAFGQRVMADAGLRVAATRDFDDFAEAIAFVQRAPGKYVYKPSGRGFASGRTFVGELATGADMVAYLALQAREWPKSEPVRLVIMDRLEGVEVGVGAYFDGHRFLEPACLDWEHKRFSGDLGELTGEMGTLVSYRRGERLFAETLGRLQQPLADSGYRGYINVNTIVDDEGVHPLELTCRFGYPGFAILQTLQLCPWEDLFRRLVQPKGAATEPFPTRQGFAAGVVLTVPPFPYSAGYDRLSKGLPIFLEEDSSGLPSRGHLHFAEVACVDGQLVTSGSIGYLMVVTGVGDTAARACEAAYARMARVHVANGRYRRDIGEKFIASDESRLQSLGWL